jgi:hypothetical protein
MEKAGSGSCGAWYLLFDAKPAGAWQNLESGNTTFGEAVPQSLCKVQSEVLAGPAVFMPKILTNSSVTGHKAFRSEELVLLSQVTLPFEACDTIFLGLLGSKSFQNWQFQREFGPVTPRQRLKRCSSLHGSHKPWRVGQNGTVAIWQGFWVRLSVIWHLPYTPYITQMMRTTKFVVMRTFGARKLVLLPFNHWIPPICHKFACS